MRPQAITHLVIAVIVTLVGTTTGARGQTPGTSSPRTAWTQSWSAEFPLMTREGPLYEYACHEGNYDIRHILEVARNLDLAAAREPANQP